MESVRPTASANTARQLSPRALHVWPAYLAYAISFLTIGGAWLLHNALTGQLARTDPVFLRLNLLLLLLMVFLPTAAVALYFPTASARPRGQHRSAGGCAWPWRWSTNPRAGSVAGTKVVTLAVRV